MSNPFKSGDKVVALASAAGNLRVGKVYTVEGTRGDNVLIAGCYANGRAVDAGLTAEYFRAAIAGQDYKPTNAAIDQHAPGAKLDHGKPQPALIQRDMSRALAAVVEIATAGAQKYTPGGWLVVPDGFNRYENAQMRHAALRHQGQGHDEESGSLHLAHEAWNALAKLELYLREQEKVKVGA